MVEELLVQMEQALVGTLLGQLHHNLAAEGPVLVEPEGMDPTFPYGQTMRPRMVFVHEHIPHYWVLAEVEEVHSKSGQGTHYRMAGVLG